MNDVTGKSVTELFNDPQSVRVMEDFCERYRDEFLQLAAREFVSRLLQDHRRMPDGVFKEFAQAVADECGERHQNKFLDAAATKLAQSFLDDKTLRAELFDMAYQYIAVTLEKKLEEKFVKEHSFVSTH